MFCLIQSLSCGKANGRVREDELRTPHLAVKVNKVPLEVVGENICLQRPQKKEDRKQEK